jgi:hypothetical protein
MEKPYQPPSDEKIEKRMIELPREIKELSYRVADLKLNWINAKANYKRSHAKVISIEKTKNPALTQTDLMALADEQTAEELIKVNVTESEYRKALADRDELRDGLSSLCGVSSNRRASGFQQKHQI